MVSNNNKNTVVKKNPDKPEILAYTFKIGNWKELFTEHQYKVLIAEALNSWINKENPKKYNKDDSGQDNKGNSEDDNRIHNVDIVGYLITERRLCLVLKVKPEQIGKMLTNFYDIVKKEIKIQRDARKRSYWEEKETVIIKITDEQYSHPFTKYQLMNDHLIKLITGREVNLPYYNTHLVRLKDRIHNYNFCSAIDYLHGVSPVIILRLDPKDFNKKKAAVENSNN